MIEAVILYSTNDYRFFKVCIDNLLKCGIKCHIITYSHMWSGELEDENILNESINYFKNNQNVIFYKINWQSGKSNWYWEGVGRYLGTQAVSENSEYILYIDIDEIVDSELFNNFINLYNYKNYDSLKLSTYWYFRKPIYQSEVTEDSVVLCKTSIAKNISFKEAGREIYVLGKSIRNVSLDNPFIHHFSWVRTKEEMLRKVANWGHTTDRENWVDLINNEFAKDFTGRDFVHGYSYKIVENKFNL
jgi:hypothetical protein